MSAVWRKSQFAARSGKCFQPISASGSVVLLIWTAISVLSVTGCGKAPASPALAPPEVQVATVTQRDVPIYGEWVATLDGFVNAQIQPQVTGYLLKQDYREGTFVKKGQVLFEIDPRTLQASLDQAKATLAQAQAQEVLAAQNVARDRPLAEAKAIAQSQLDSDVQTQLADQAVVQADQAQVAQAEISLGFAKVRSLIDGIAGISSGQIGNLVGPTTVLTTVSQVDPIKANFAIGEPDYIRIAKRVSSVAMGDLPRPSNSPPLQLILSDGSTYSRSGRVFLLNREVDAKTGTLQVVATFPNPEGILRPGQFGRVRFVTDTLKGALLVPQRAVTELQGTYQVAVVGTDDKVTIQPVQVGPRVGSLWVIQEGLKPGEQVVAEGTEKVREGSAVIPKPYSGSD